MRSKVVIAMVLAFGILAVVQAQPGRGFGGGGPMLVSQIVNNKDVQQELKMTEEQTTKISAWVKDFRPKEAEIRKEKGVEFGGGGGNKGKGGGFTPPTPEQLEKQAAANAEITKVAYKELGDILKKEQVERLKQIDRQNMGLNAFSDAEVASTLKLSDSQKNSIKSLNTDLGKDRREIMAEAGFGGKGGGKFDPEKMKEVTDKAQKVSKDYLNKAVALLDDEQKKTWKGMIGEAFDTSKLTAFPMRKKD